MIFLAVCMIVIGILAVLYLLAIRPNQGRQSEMEPFERQYIAHRGLFDQGEAPENSLPAFARAAEAGYGIELDVQLTADDQLVVFHDATLERMCGDRRVLHETSFQELRRMHLLDTKEKIPLFKDVLTLVDGAVPLVIEIKPEGRYFETSRLVNEMLADYRGVYCLESFHPLVLWWYKKNNPSVLRGQLSSNFLKNRIDMPWWIRFVLTNLLCNFLTRPDFIAYNQNFTKQVSFMLCRKLYHPVNGAWTIQSQEQLEKAKDTFEIFVFDSFIPDRKKL